MGYSFGTYSSIPNQSVFPNREETGLTKLEYFAARAPKERLWDFEAVSSLKKPIKSLYPLDPIGVEDYERACIRYYEKLEEIKNQQWPWEWAKRVLEMKAFKV